jgi:hypothetical protein
MSDAGSACGFGGGCCGQGSACCGNMACGED